MTTAASPRPLKERQGTKLVKFENPGDRVEGVLLAVRKTQMMEDGGKKRDAIEYIVRGHDGARQKFLGTWAINDKLSREDTGLFVVVTFEGEDKTIQKNGHYLRKFKVEVDEQHAKEKVEELVITDEDIPF